MMHTLVVCPYYQNDNSSVSNCIQGYSSEKKLKFEVKQFNLPTIAPVDQISSPYFPSMIDKQQHNPIQTLNVKQQNTPPLLNNAFQISPMSKLPIISEPIPQQNFQQQINPISLVNVQQQAQIRSPVIDQIEIPSVMIMNSLQQRTTSLPPNEQQISPVTIINTVVQQDSQQHQNFVSPHINKILTFYTRLRVREATHNPIIRDMYKGLMFNKRMERQQANSAYLISQMFSDTFMPILDLMRTNRQQSDQLACLFVEEHLDFLITAKKGVVRKQIQNDKLICAFAILVKLLRAQRVEGRQIFNTLLAILTSRLGVLFIKDLNPNPLDLIVDQKYFGEIFYSSQSIPPEQAPADDANLRYLSVIRKLSMLLWAILWLDPNIFLTDEMRQNLDVNGSVLKMYSKIDSEKDRSIFYEYVKSFGICAKQKPQFHILPALSSLWDILSYSIYKSQRHQISLQENEDLRQLLKTIFEKCQASINLPHNESIQLDTEILNNTTSCLKYMKISFPQLSSQFIKNIHNELFVNPFYNQRGQVEILKTKEGITNHTINQRNEDYNDYDFYKNLFETDQRQEYYT